MTEQLRTAMHTIGIDLKYGLTASVFVTISFRVDRGERRSYDNPGCAPFVHDVEFRLDTVIVHDAKGKSVALDLTDADKDELLTLASNTLTEDDVQTICLNAAASVEPY